MDLLRAAIVGAQATPYHDGLFIFDIHLSEEFPHVPPVSTSEEATHRHSLCLTVNIC